MFDSLKVDDNVQSGTALDNRFRVGWLNLSGRGDTRAEDAQGTPTRSHLSPSILVYEDHLAGRCYEEVWVLIGRIEIRVVNTTATTRGDHTSSGKTQSCALFLRPKKQCIIPSDQDQLGNLNPKPSP